MHHLLQHSLCNVLQRCPRTEVCVRHELPVHWRIQGNPAKLSQMTIRVSGGEEEEERGGRRASRQQHLHIQHTNTMLYIVFVWIWGENM